jgi:hypothetical protein
MRGSMFRGSGHIKPLSRYLRGKLPMAMLKASAGTVEIFLWKRIWGASFLQRWNVSQVQISIERQMEAEMKVL